MSRPLGKRAQRLQPVEAAAADDKQIGVGRCGDERADGFIRRLLAQAVDDCIDLPSVDCPAAVGDDRPQLGAGALGQVTGYGVDGRRLRRSVDADDDPRGELVPRAPLRATSTSRAFRARLRAARAGR